MPMNNGAKSAVISIPADAPFGNPEREETCGTIVHTSFHYRPHTEDDVKPSKGISPEALMQSVPPFCVPAVTDHPTKNPPASKGVH